MTSRLLLLIILIILFVVLSAVGFLLYFNPKISGINMTPKELLGELGIHTGSSPLVWKINK